MRKRKNKAGWAIVVLWIIIIVVAAIQLRSPSVVNERADSANISVAPPSNTRVPSEAGALPTNAASGSELQGSVIPSDVISNLLQ